jgi:MoaA/NifB/PqqE/SkfB family radical SAM enzyme
MMYRILYRGPLSSCNYGCPYCPFAKHTETRAEHAQDATALTRFVGRVRALSQHQFGILFTPWGEALIRRRYQQALIDLTQMAHVERAAIQTNLSCRLDWVEDCDKTKLALWATYHPGETHFARFVAQCERLSQRGVRYSVGVVGMREHVESIEAIRAILPENIYVWINAYKRENGYYDSDTLARFTEVDPYFPINNVRHVSNGRACRTGKSVFSVDGDGVMRRCHFVKAPIGNFYAEDFESVLKPRPCPNASCGCHIGYVHRPDLGLETVYGANILERIPADM